MSVLRDIAVFLCGFLLFRLCNAQIIYHGSCPEVAAITDFKADRYLGKWYEIEKYFAVFELGGKCITANYDMKDDGIISVRNKQLNIFTGIKSEIDGEAVQMGRADEGKLSVRFPSLPANIAAPYWVVDTDYDNYSLVWSCYDFGIFHTRNAWILTRARHPSADILDKAYRAAEKNHINRGNFIKTDQTDCSDEDY